MAGSGEACTHIAALLYAIEATVKIRDSKYVTQETVYWLLYSDMKKIAYKEIKDIDIAAAKTVKRKLRSLLDDSTCDTQRQPQQCAELHNLKCVTAMCRRLRMKI